jgi:hypothetical protein
MLTINVVQKGKEKKGGGGQCVRAEKGLHDQKKIRSMNV